MSYFELYQIWLDEDLEENDGECTIFAEQLLSYLVIHKIIAKDQENQVRNYRNINDQNQVLFREILARKGLNGLKTVIQWYKINQSVHEEKLTNIAKKLVGKIDLKMDSNKRITTEQELMQILQSNLKNVYSFNVDSIANYWRKCHLQYQDSNDIFTLPSSKNEKLIVCVKRTGVPMDNYVPLFEDDNKLRRYKRIVIEGDPGCGKTTFVNKLTKDWVDEHEYLRWRFDCVFHFQLQLLKGSTSKAVQTFVPPEMKIKLKHHLEDVANRILIIFDAFDELPENHPSYGAVSSILNKSRFAHVTVIVTCRKSHIDRLPQGAFENWLHVKGFDDKSVINFLNRNELAENQQNVLKLNFLKHSLQLPLFGRIYSILNIGGQEIRSTVSLYDLIDNFVDNILETKSSGVADEKFKIDMKKLGKFALSKLYILWYNDFVDDENNHMEFGKNDSENCEIDWNYLTTAFLTKLKVPTGVYGKFVDEFVFPHHLIAECLAARYLLDSLDFLKTHPEKLFEPHRFDIPMVQFLLNGILARWMKGELELEHMKRYLQMPNLYYFWYSKVEDQKWFPDLRNVKIVEFKFAEEIGKSFSFFKNLSKCTNLERLILPSCRLTSDCLHALSMDMTKNKFTKLEYIDFRDNGNIGNESEFFDALKFYPNLNHLNVSYCELSQKSVQSLMNAFVQNGLTKLQFLHLQGNEEIGKADALFESLKNQRNLRKLDIGDCALSKESFHALTSPSSNDIYFPLLEELELDFNEVVGKESHLLLGLEKCRNLKVLLLFGCNIPPNERFVLEKIFRKVQLKNVW